MFYNSVFGLFSYMWELEVNVYSAFVWRAFVSVNYNLLADGAEFYVTVQLFYCRERSAEVSNSPVFLCSTSNFCLTHFSTLFYTYTIRVAMFFVRLVFLYLCNVTLCHLYMIKSQLRTHNNFKCVFTYHENFKIQKRKRQIQNYSWKV